MAALKNHIVAKHPVRWSPSVRFGQGRKRARPVSGGGARVNQMCDGPGLEQTSAPGQAEFPYMPSFSLHEPKSDLVMRMYRRIARQPLPKGQWLDWGNDVLSEWQYKPTSLKETVMLTVREQMQDVTPDHRQQLASLLAVLEKLPDEMVATMAAGLAKSGTVGDVQEGR